MASCMASCMSSGEVYILNIVYFLGGFFFRYGLPLQKGAKSVLIESPALLIYPFPYPLSC